MRKTAYFFLYKCGNEEREMLFIPKNNEFASKWTGIKLSIPEVMALSETEEVFYLDEFEKYINEIGNSEDMKNIYCTLDENNQSENYNLNLRMFKEMYKVFDNLEFYNIKKCIDSLREVKTKYEVR